MPKTRAELAPVEQRTLHRDYETRSRASLKACGALRYAADPSTMATCGHGFPATPFQRNLLKLRQIRAGSSQRMAIILKPLLNGMCCNLSAGP